jgi:hypothetical protein
MEIHHDKVVADEIPNLAEGPFKYFEKAKKFAYDNYAEEIKRISSTTFATVTGEKFFHEYIWTVHTTGFSAKAVGKFFPRLLEAYGPYDRLAAETKDIAFERVRLVCNNQQKIMSVWMTATRMRNGIQLFGWEKFRQDYLSSPDLLAKFPYVGKITQFHLARNIGLLDSVKPDLHLVRMAKYWNFEDCTSMCKALQEEGMPLGIVDLLLWYSASTWGTTNIRQPGER